MATTNEVAHAEVILDGKKANSTIKDLENNVKALTAEWRKLTIGTAEYTAKGKEIQKLNTDLIEHRKNIKAVSDEYLKGQLSIGNMFSSLKSSVLSFGTMAAAAFAVDKLVTYFEEGVKKAIAMRDSEKLLLDVLDGNKAAQRELISLAKERSGSTKFTRLEIEESEKFLVIQGRSQEQIRKTITASMDLATVTGNTLKNSVEDLDGTMEGRLGKSLGKLSKDFRELTTQQLFNGAAIDIVAKKYDGLAQEEMQTTEGKLILLDKSWSALQRTIGDAALGTNGVFSGLIRDATTLLNTFKKMVEVPLSQKLQEESNHVNALASELLEANVPAERRNKLYKELEILAPQITSGLDSENLSYQELTKNLAAYNDQMVNKIILQKQDEKVENANAEVAKWKMQMFEQETLVLEKVQQAIVTETNTAKRLGGNRVADTKVWVEKLKAIMNDPGLTFAQKAPKIGLLAPNLYVETNDYTQLLKAMTEALKDQVTVMDEKKKIMAQLGITLAVEGKKEVDGSKHNEDEIFDYKKMTLEKLNELVNENSVKPQTKGMIIIAKAAQAEIDHREKTNDKLIDQQQKANAKVKESYQNLMDSLKEMENKNFADKLSQTQQEIRNVEDKYNTLIEKALKYKSENSKMLSPTEKKSIDDNVSNLEINRDKQIKQVLVQAENQFASDVKMIHENLRVARMAVTERQIYEVNKKYKDATKEIYDAINFAYSEEVKAANGNNEKIIQAAKNKADALKAIEKDLANLKKAQKEEVQKTKDVANTKFDEDLNNLKLKGERALADGKLRIQLDVNAKYKKILEDNVMMSRRLLP